MSIWNSIKSDIKINSEYGDIEILGGDLVLSKTNKEIAKHVIIERFKTNLNDFQLNPNYGANLEEYLGRGINNKLIEEIVTRLRFILTYDNYFNSSEIELLPVILDKNSIKIMLYLTTSENDPMVAITYNEGEFSFD